MTDTKRKPNRKKPLSQPRRRQTSKGFRRLRLLLLLCMAAGAVFYRDPLMNAVGRWIPPRQTSVGTAPAPELPSEPRAITVRKGLVYTLQGNVLRALKADGAVQWERVMDQSGEWVISGYDGVLVKLVGEDRLVRYSPLGKPTGDVVAPGIFTALYESGEGILFENRASSHYVWTDSSGAPLGEQTLPEEYILRTAIDVDTGDTVIATLKADNGTVESTLHRFDAYGRLTGARTFRDAVLLQIQFLGSRFLVVMDDQLISLNEQMKDHWVIREPAIYSSVSYGPGSVWVGRIQTGMQENQVLQCYSPEGTVTSSVAFPDPITLLAAGPVNQVAAVSGQRLRIYSEKGSQTADIQLAKVPQDIHWLNDKHLLIVYGDAVVIENIAKRNPL